ncbi:ileal sodium/bile acid cotransporter-like [Ptychodera flava]|uniref:ileal sodium/bile acid cotransporter-like n=1 Tax=Ptychodera flava TaxID=63121 RepID=UPI00396A65C5
METINDTMLNLTNITSATAVPPMTPLVKRLFLADQIITYVVIVLIMMGMGGATEVSEIKRSIRRPWGILICWLTQFVIMPLAAFGLAHAIDLRPEYAIGLIIQCSSPGGSMSNVFAFYAKGNVSLSICLTACSTILAVGAMPLCLFLYGRSWSSSGSVSIPYLTVIISLALVLVPAAIGLFLKYKLPKYIERITQVCSLVGLIGLLVGVGIRAYINPSVFSGMDWTIWLITLFLPVLAGTVGFASSSIIRLPCSSRRTIAIETACQNVALSLTVINSSFPSGPQRAAMQVIPSLYGPVLGIEILVGIVLFRVLHARGYCKACNYGDVDKEEEVVLKVDTPDEDEKGTAEGDGGIAPPALMNGATEAIQMEAQNGVPKKHDFGTNTEYEYTNFAFEGDEVDDDQVAYKDKGTNTEECYFT